MTNNPQHQSSAHQGQRAPDISDQSLNMPIDAALRGITEGGLSLVHSAATLPIVKHLDEFRIALEHNDIIIICAEPGAGKSTQVPQYFARLGYRIFHALPTRIAVTSIQAEVERQFGGHNGAIVGYKHGRGEMIGQDFKIMFCSDGLLYERILREEYFKQYNRDNFNDIFIVDECHIFNKNIEHILALYKKYRVQGAVPKLIIMSATINADEIADFLKTSHDVVAKRDIPIFSIKGRQFPIVDLERGESRISDILNQIDQGRGHIIDFYPGEREIESVITELESYQPDALLLRLHGKLSAAEQNRVHEVTDQIKYIATTNVAETSLTIKGVRVSINGGLERVLTTLGDEETLGLETNSWGTYHQRRGRCGRDGEGLHINWGPPLHKLPAGHWEMQKSTLHGHFLRLIAAGEDPCSLEFVHNPSEEARNYSIQWLRKHGFLNEQGERTQLGDFAASLPIEPREAKILHRAMETSHMYPQIIRPMIDVVAILSVRDFRQSSDESLLNLIDPSLHHLVRSSENLANLCALEAIYKETDPVKRAALFETYGVREAAANEVLQIREEIATRLEISSTPLGETDLKSIPLEPLLDASAMGWSDHIFRYIGRDAKGSALYRDIADPDALPRKLNRYALIGEPNLVTGKLFSIGLQLNIRSENDILRLITQASLVPSTLLKANPRLAKIEHDVLNFRNVEKRANRIEMRRARNAPGKHGQSKRSRR